MTLVVLTQNAEFDVVNFVGRLISDLTFHESDEKRSVDEARHNPVTMM